MYSLHGIVRWLSRRLTRPQVASRPHHTFTREYLLYRNVRPWTSHQKPGLAHRPDNSCVSYTGIGVRGISRSTSYQDAQLRKHDENDASNEELQRCHKQDKRSLSGFSILPRLQHGFALDNYHTRFQPGSVPVLAEHEDTHSSGSIRSQEEYKFSTDDKESLGREVDTQPFRHATKNDDAESQVTPTSPKFISSRTKVDLSYQHVRHRESAAATAGRVSSPSIPPTKFRGNAGVRMVVHQYMQHLEPLLSKKSRTALQDHQLDFWVTKIFNSESLYLLQERDLTIEDVVTCCWILSPPNGDSSIERYRIISRSRVNDDKRPLPHFVLLQILRSERISANCLSSLLNEIEYALKNQLPWTQDSGAILLIRLLRHGRSTGIACYERIVGLAPRILPLNGSGNVHDNTQRLTHFYNRFLSLLALPLATHPFLSIEGQQRAQLEIARLMMKSRLRIPLNREGYRALARVQLIHQKTIDEQQWSHVKAPSWPPWRRDELGIDERTDYPGRQSRVSKVIKRLLEAGYGPESVEYEAQILGGQDTDKSPTVQVRRLTSRRPLAWIRDMFQHKHDEEASVDHNLWAARVAATRSVREAWLCFYSYIQATMDQQRQHRVYHEMFSKLFARTQGTDQRATPSPGDGKEVFPDPVSARDLVYVPKEPPSVDELYTQMLQDGVRPAGRLLASLIDSARSLKQGLAIIDDSLLGDVKKDVLLHPEKYPGYVIRNLFTTLPDYLLASYTGLLTKHYNSEVVDLYWPGSKSTEERGSLPTTPIKPLLYGMTLLQIWKPTYLPAYHAVLEGICTHAMVRRPKKSGGATSRLHSYAELWKMAQHVLDLLEQTRMQVDLLCYRKLVLLVRNLMIRAPAQFGGGENHLQHVVPLIKSAFVKALGGRIKCGNLLLPGRALSVGRQPYWKDIESLIMLLGFNRDFASLIQIWEWLRNDQEFLECVDSDNSYKMQRLLCATRIAIEGSWNLDRSLGANADDVRQLRQIVHQWEWPEDVDVAEFMSHHQVWLEGMRAATQRPLE